MFSLVLYTSIYTPVFYTSDTMASSIFTTSFFSPWICLIYVVRPQALSIHSTNSLKIEDKRCSFLFCLFPPPRWDDCHCYVVFVSLGWWMCVERTLGVVDGWVMGGLGPRNGMQVQVLCIKVKICSEVTLSTHQYFNAIFFFFLRWHYYHHLLSISPNITDLHLCIRRFERSTECLKNIILFFPD